MTKPKYSEYREKWRAASLEPGHMETKLLIAREDHVKVVALAQTLGARIPVVIGQLVVAGMAGRPQKPMEPLSSPVPPLQTVLAILDKMIDKSRFAKDTGAARYRQIAFIHRLADEISSGRKPTIQSMASSVVSHYSQIEVLSKVMEKRGVIIRQHVPGLTKTRSGKVLFIREDAIKALNQAHIDQVGCPLILLDNNEPVFLS